MTHKCSRDDEEFRRSFEAFEVPTDDFNHKAHVRLAYVYLCGTDPDQAAIDLPFILMSQSYLYEALGRRSGAMEKAEEVLALGPNEHFSTRLRRLRQGNDDPEAAKERLRRLFQKTHECDREEHVHGCGCASCAHDHDHDHDHGHDHGDEGHVHGPDCDH